jgi:hypothetical protein
MTSAFLCFIDRFQKAMKNIKALLVGTPANSRNAKTNAASIKKLFTFIANGMQT